MAESLFHRVTDSRSATVLKSDSPQVFSYEFYQIFQNSFL